MQPTWMYCGKTARQTDLSLDMMGRVGLVDAHLGCSIFELTVGCVCSVTTVVTDHTRETVELVADFNEHIIARTINEWQR